MATVLNDYLGQLNLGGKQVYKNMAVFPLLSTYTESLDYVVLDEALEAGSLEVTEVNEEGAVPELKVQNKSSKMVLILDGEELVGAKQNRIVNTTVLVAGSTTMVIPVSCVEQGRWSYKGPRFQSEERIMSSSLRSKKAKQVNYSVRMSGEFHADQGEIWNEISEQACRRDADSPTMAMADIYEKEATSIDEYVKHFSLVDSQVGAVLMINGRVVGLDSFGRAATFSKFLKKLVKSYSLDAIDRFSAAREYTFPESIVTAFLKHSKELPAEPRVSVGLGTDFRMDSEQQAGFALAHDNQLLHLSVFTRTDDRVHEMGATGMQSYSSRRRNRSR